MFKTRRPIPGSSPATLVPHLVDGKIIPPKITVIEYDKNTIEEREISSIAGLGPHLDNRKITWINIDGLGDVARAKPIRVCCVDMPPLERPEFARLPSASAHIDVYRSSA